MFRFDNYCEAWAQNFIPIGHDPKENSKNTAFYRMDSYDKISDLCKNLPKAKSPAMAAVTHIECDPDPTRPNLLHYVYTAYILVRQEEDNLKDELLAANAKAEGHELAVKFLAWLDYDKTELKNPLLQALDFSRASIFTAPGKYNGWWATEVMIDNVMPRQLCIDPKDYVTLKKRKE